MDTFSVFVLWAVSFEMGCADGGVVRSGGVVLWCALSREDTLVMPVVLTSKEGTVRGGEVLTWRVVVVTPALWRDKGGDNHLYQHLALSVVQVVEK